MSPKTALLKQTSEQRCREAYERVMRPNFNPIVGHEGAKDGPMYSKQEWAMVQWGWQQCWKYLESRLIEEIQS